jgi:type IV secretion system protein VirB1
MIDFASLIHHCAPTVAPALVEAIIRTESGFDPLALHVNGNVRLRSPPRTAAQAAAWSDWLIGHGYSVDMGLMQINSRNLTSLNLITADAFDPCRNIRAGATILTAQYGRAAQISGPGTRALVQAISAYNTGTFTSGIRNGYVGKVVMNVPNGRTVPTFDLTCLLTRCSARAVNSIESSPYTADSAVGGFGRAVP